MEHCRQYAEKIQMKIFITGIAGFIGFHLARFLKRRGDFVMGCDHFNSYYDPALKRARAAHLAAADISVIETDIADSTLLKKIVVDKEVTHFVHLAAQAGVRYSITHPESYVHSNLDGFVHVMEVCRHRPQMKCIYASSSSVYGLNEKIPFSEKDPTDRPANLYAATKKSNELIAHSYHHLFGISVTGLRYFTVYGPWGRPDMAYFSFARCIWDDLPLSLYNRGHVARDFTYIDDIVCGTAAAIDLGAPCEIFNLGGEMPLPVLTLVKMLEQEIGKCAKSELVPMQPGEILSTHADITKAKSLLGFAPSISHEEGIKRFVAWYCSYRQGREFI